ISLSSFWETKATLLLQQSNRGLIQGMAVREGTSLSLDDDTSRHGWHVEPAVERKNSSLACTYGNGCVMDWTGISWASGYDHIVSIGRTNRKGMICVSRVVEANY